MDHKLSRYTCALWIMSAIFTAARYIAAAILIGAPCDFATFRSAMEALGPFLPTMSTVCLAGGAVLILGEEILIHRNKKG